MQPVQCVSHHYRSVNNLNMKRLEVGSRHRHDTQHRHRDRQLYKEGA